MNLINFLFCNYWRSCLWKDSFSKKNNVLLIFAFGFPFLSTCCLASLKRSHIINDRWLQKVQLNTS